MIGLPTVTFLGGEDGTNGEACIHLETKVSSVGCPKCGVVARVKDRFRVELVDLAMFGRPVRPVWHKRRWVLSGVKPTCRSAYRLTCRSRVGARVHSWAPPPFGSTWSFSR